MTLAAFRSIAMISLMGTLLAAAETRFRARVMGVRTLAVSGMPLGLIAVRWRASVWQGTRAVPTAA